jgi:hypothetical protein
VIICLSLLEGVGDRFVVCEDAEVARFQPVVEMLYDLVDGQQLVVVITVFLLDWVEFFGKESEEIPGVLDVLKHDTHGGRDEYKWRGWIGCASRMVRDRLALNSSKVLWSSGVQVMGWEPWTLGPERTS